MSRDVEFLLDKYYNGYGQEKWVNGEIWTNEHAKKYLSEQRLQMKLGEAQRLGFRLSQTEKDQVAYIIELLDNNFKKLDYTLSNEQVLVMIICFLRIAADESCNKHIYYKKLREYDVSDRMFISFLIKLLKIYRA